MEAKYIACSTTVQEAMCLKKFVDDLKINNIATNPVTIDCDSQAAIFFFKDAKYHSKLKHIEIKYHFIRDVLVKKKVVIQYISTHNMITNPLTKALIRDVFTSNARSLGLYRL